MLKFIFTKHVFFVLYFLIFFIQCRCNTKGCLWTRSARTCLPNVRIEKKRQKQNQVSDLTERSYYQGQSERNSHGHVIIADNGPRRNNGPQMANDFNGHGHGNVEIFLIINLLNIYTLYILYIKKEK